MGVMILQKNRFSMTSAKPLLFLLMVAWHAILWAQTSGASSQLEEQYQLSLKLGDQFYYSREISGNYEKALQYYDQALRLKPNQGEIYLRLSRAMYGISRAEVNPEKKTQLIQKGIDYAEKSVELSPQSHASYIILGMSYGHYVMHQGLWRAWYYIFPVKHAMETALQLDPRNPYAHLILGTWHSVVPWWLGGDQEKGIEYLYLATEYQPDYTTHFLHLSRYLLDLGRKEEAKPILQQLFEIENPHDPMIAIEDRLEAKKLIQQFQLTLTLPSY